VQAARGYIIAVPGRSRLTYCLPPGFPGDANRRLAPFGIWHDHPATEGLIVDLQAIRVLIRAKLRDGSLPPNSSPNAFGRPGNREKCGACGEILTAVRLMMDLTSNAKTFLLHGDCYLLWMEERPASTS
jgi:hypothetical protein